MKLLSVIVALSALVACSSSDSTPTPAAGNTDQDKGLTGTGVGSASSAPDTNPAGVAYPTSGIGTTKGTVIQNFKFLGYKDANINGGLQPISLADFFDPTTNDYKLVHIQAAGSWCSACKGETTALVPIAAQLQAKKVLWLVSLAEGPTPGTPSTQTDLNNWINEFKSPFTHVLDPSNKNLGPFYDASALPWNANIDAKTMKILTTGTGGAQTSDEIMQDIDDALASIP